MEKEIGAIEDRQRECSVALADPSTYADEARRHTLIMEYQQGVKALEDLVARWEVAQAELEEAEAAFEGE